MIIFFKLGYSNYTRKINREVQKLARSKTPSEGKKSSKKSFWFEFADKKGVNPYKSAWAEFETQEKKKKQSSIRYCSKCGYGLVMESRYCERCGLRVKRDL